MDMAETGKTLLRNKEQGVGSREQGVGSREFLR